MKVVVINPFDPLPGEPIRLGRYAAFCRALAGRGHEVCWYSSDFSHALKRRRDTAAIRRSAEGAGYRVAFLSGRAYTRNVGWRRWRNHRQLRRGLRATWRGGGDRPDAILVSLPTPGLGREAAAWSEACGARLVVDVQDLWPQTFARLLPRPLRWANRLAFAWMVHDVRETYHRADAVIGAARQYVEDARPWLRPGARSEVLPLGVDLAEFDGAVVPLEELGLEKAVGEKWLFLGGALSGYVDLDGTLAMMEELQRRGREEIGLLVVGTGPDESRLRAVVQTRGLANVRVLGQKSYREFVSLAVACDAAVCPIKPEACVYFPNRAFDYFAAGLPILNTAPGDLADVLAERKAGITCISRDPSEWADAVEELLTAGGGGARQRGDWVAEYDRPAIAERLADLVESL